MGEKSHIEKQNVYFFGAFVLLTIIGYFHFSQFADYTYLSDRHYLDIIRSKVWALIWVTISFLFLYLKRDSKFIHLYAIFAVSIYFIILYGILFRGTEYGLNGHWGDNSYRLPMVQKMISLGGLHDPFQKDLSAMYPPLWFVLISYFSKIINIEAYQTVKYGYFLIFLIYPWLIYFSWKKIIDNKIAAILAASILFFAKDYLDYTYYEHISLFLFVPWWIYYFDNYHDKRFKIFEYISAILIGAALFSLYYWWFFIAVIIYPLAMYLKHKSNFEFKKIISEIRHQSILVIGIIVCTSFYWLPLIFDIMNNSFTNNQAQWFRLEYADLSAYLKIYFWHTLIIFTGIFCLGYYSHNKIISKVALLTFGGFLLVITDRIFNLGFSSLQSRKYLEYLFHLMIIPTVIGISMFKTEIKSTKMKKGITAILFLLAIFICNHHTQIYKDKLYSTSINQRPPVNKINALYSVNPIEKVFLTGYYIETCYIPYYMFLQITNVGTHFAGSYEGRVQFLKESAKIKEPQLFSYILQHNIYDTIQFFYLPKNNDSMSYEMKFNEIPFNKPANQFSIMFPDYLIEDNQYFIKKHKEGIYEIVPQPFSNKVESVIRVKYQEISKYLQSSS